MTECCKTCKYWIEFRDGKTGGCRRYPPRPAGERGIVLTPQTVPEWWCGEWRAKS